MIYDIVTKKNENDVEKMKDLTICVPRKCGTSSWQRALISQLSHFYWENRLPSNSRTILRNELEKDHYYYDSKSEYLNFSRPLSSDEIKSPKSYFVTSQFRTSMPITTKNEIRVINFRNPFERLYSAYSDKFNLKSSFLNVAAAIHNENDPVKNIFKAVEMFNQKGGYKKPKGYFSSFEAFIRYITMSDTKSQNGHWRNFFWDCKPCQYKYNYIFNLHKVASQSKFIFEKLGYKARLPTKIGVPFVKSGLKSYLKNPYKNVPKSGVQEVYRKYYLDFVLLGFTADEVIETVNSAHGKEYDTLSKNEMDEVNLFLQGFVDANYANNKVRDEVYDNCLPEE